MVELRHWRVWHNLTHKSFKIFIFPISISSTYITFNPEIIIIPTKGSNIDSFLIIIHFSNKNM